SGIGPVAGDAVTVAEATALASLRWVGTGGAPSRAPAVHVSSVAPSTKSATPSAERWRRSMWVSSRADPMPTEGPSYADRRARAAASLGERGVAALLVSAGADLAY